MVMASKSGGRTKIQKAKVDRISNLPDEVLSLILSFLPTECAVGTSILSSRWKYLWTSITSLLLEAPPNYRKFLGFAKFIEYVFRSCSSPHIQKFSLHDHKSKASNVISWIDEVIKRNVNELDIHVYIWKFPMRIFSCRTLKILTLADFYYSDRKYFVSFNLPCLKVIHIKGKSFLNDCIEMLISSCPVLEELTLSGYVHYDKESCSRFMVSAPTLKTLRLQLSAYIWITGANKISIAAPNLEYLHLNDYFIGYKFKGDFSSVVKACVNIGDFHLGDRYRTFQRELPHRFTFPKFQNLKCLEVITCHDLFWSMLPKLIRISPILEFLSIEQHGDDKLLYDENDWVGPTFVPKCLRFHLAVIRIKGFMGRKHELQLLEYFLGNAKVLQMLTINCLELKRVEKKKFCEQLLKFSRASRECQIQFQGEVTSKM